MSIGPDGNLWGLADGTVFVFNLKNHKVVSRVTAFDGSVSARDGDMVWNANGLLYVTNGGHFFSVNPKNMQVTMIRDNGVRRLTMTPDGTMYTMFQPGGGSNLTHLASYVPARVR